MGVAQLKLRYRLGGRLRELQFACLSLYANTVSAGIHAIADTNTDGNADKYAITNAAYFDASHQR